MSIALQRKFHVSIQDDTVILQNVKHFSTWYDAKNGFYWLFDFVDGTTEKFFQNEWGICGATI